jgi:aldehyde dehydrogenase (NAD+)
VSGIFAATGQTCIAGSRLWCRNPFTSSSSKSCLRWQDREDGRSHEPGNAGRSGDDAPQYEKCCPTSTSAQDEGRQLRMGGARPRDRMRQGWFVSRRSSRRRQQDAHRAGERCSGRCCLIMRFQGRGRSRAHRQRCALRPGRRVWTRDIGRADPHGRKSIQAGTVWVKHYRAVSYMSPFGGLQGQRHSPGERRAGDLRVPADEERMDQHRRAHRQSFVMR